MKKRPIKADRIVYRPRVPKYFPWSETGLSEEEKQHELNQLRAKIKNPITSFA
jgi:hypothetical protein